MKRTLVVLASACAVLLTFGAGSAFAGGLLPGAGQSVTNGTSQSNKAVSVNVPILSGNNVALINGGSQTASAGTTQTQENSNTTVQSVHQSSAPASHCGCSSGSSDQSVSNATDQSNRAVSVNVPIASGNNVALVNFGDQKASSGTTQKQSNQNVTVQDVRQSSGAAPAAADPQVRNHTDQSNVAESVNAPILSGNNVALINGGSQTASAGTTQHQVNQNVTWQSVEQHSSAGGRC